MVNDTGTMDKIKGKTNEAVGKMTGDKSQEFKGKVQSGVGEGKNAVDDAKKSL